MNVGHCVYGSFRLETFSCIFVKFPNWFMTIWRTSLPAQKLRVLRLQHCPAGPPEFHQRTKRTWRSLEEKFTIISLCPGPEGFLNAIKVILTVVYGPAIIRRIASTAIILRQRILMDPVSDLLLVLRGRRYRLPSTSLIWTSKENKEESEDHKCERGHEVGEDRDAEGRPRFRRLNRCPQKEQLEVQEEDIRVSSTWP